MTEHEHLEHSMGHGRHEREPQLHPVEQNVDAAIADAGIETQWWYNMRTNEVEEGPQSLAIYRIGPFSTRDAAARALETLRARADEWAKEDD